MTGACLDGLLLLQLCNSATNCDSISCRLFRLEIALEDHYVELTIVRLGHLNEDLDSTHLLPFNKEDGAKVRNPEGLSFNARQKLLRP